MGWAERLNPNGAWYRKRHNVVKISMPEKPKESQKLSLFKRIINWLLKKLWL